LKSTGQNGGFNWSTAIGSFTFPGCGSGGSPKFNLGTSPNSVTVFQGGTGTSTITVTPYNGFDGSVQLSASGLPSGVTAQFVPNPTTTTSTLTFTATGSAALGTVTVTITGVSGDLTRMAYVSLTVEPQVSGISISPSALSFGSVIVEASSKPKTATLTNGGSGTLDINSIVTSTNFTQTNKCGATLAPGKTCTISVTFTPTQVGALTGTLSVNDNGTNTPQTVSLSGTGKAQATLTPASATFSKTKVGSKSAAKSFKLSNNQTVQLKNIVISTTGEFSVSSTNCASTLTSQASCTIEVVFSPTQTGTLTGTLQVSDNAVGSPQTAALKGTGD